MDVLIVFKSLMSWINECLFIVINIIIIEFFKKVYYLKEIDKYFSSFLWKDLILLILFIIILKQLSISF